MKHCVTNKQMLQSLIEPYVFGTVSVKNNNELSYVVLISEAYSLVLFTLQL